MRTKTCAMEMGKGIQRRGNGKGGKTATLRTTADPIGNDLLPMVGGRDFQTAESREYRQVASTGEEEVVRGSTWWRGYVRSRFSNSSLLRMWKVNRKAYSRVID